MSVRVTVKVPANHPANATGAELVWTSSVFNFEAVDALNRELVKLSPPLLADGKLEPFSHVHECLSDLYYKMQKKPD
jgi:hypothetical protein